MTACIPHVPTSAACVDTLNRPLPVEAEDQALRLPDSKPSAKIASVVAVGVFVAVGGTGVFVGVNVGVFVAVGGTGVFVGVVVALEGGRGVAVSAGVAVTEGVGVAVRVAVGVRVVVAVGVCVTVGGDVGVLVAPLAVVYVITNLGAVAADPSKPATNFRPQAAPVPFRMTDRLFPLCQSPRFTISCTTGAISSKAYHVLACHCTFELCATFCVVSVRCDGRLLAEKVGLLPVASAARLRLRLSH